MQKRKYGEGTIRLHENGLYEGRIIVRNIGYKPIFKYAYTETYEECEQRLKELKIENGVIDKSMFSPSMPFKDWVKIWMQYTAFKKSKQTIKSYQVNLDNYILPILGDRPLNKITTGVLELYYASLLKSGRLKAQKDEVGLSSNMVRTLHKLITAIFNTALERSFIKKNPASKARVPYQHICAKKIYSYDELKLILEAARQKGYYELILFALCTGMERSEICALKWKDIRMKTGEVKITHCMKYEKKEYYLEPVKKQSQNRTIFLSKRLLKVLTEYKKKSKSIWVFPSFYGYGLKPRSANSLTTEFRKILTLAGISEGSFKSLRDTYAVICLDNGMDIRTLSSVMGFDNVKTIKSSFIKYMTTKKVVAANKMEGAMMSIKTLYG